MSRTYKDQKQNKVSGIAKSKKQEKQLNQKFVNYKLNGLEGAIPDEEDEEQNLDGDTCPSCGEPTSFGMYCLICNKCGWIDAGEEALENAIDLDAA